jgi:hypothetical protein
MDIEDLIRTTQARQADRALPADHVRAALPRKVARARRQRRLGLLTGVVAAAAVATASTVPALTVRHTDTTVAAAPTPSVTEPDATPLPDFRLGYRPAWTPPGYSEHIRQANIADPAEHGFGPTVVRVWTKRVGAGDPWGGAELVLSVRTEVAGAVPDPGGQKVDINGSKGSYFGAQGDHKSYVGWAPDTRTRLTLAASHLDISRADLLRMARSVRPDPGSHTVPVRLRWLPADWTAIGATVSGASKATWRCEVAAAKAAPDPISVFDKKAAKEGGHSSPGSMSVVVGAVTDAPAGGDALTVGGRPARHPVRADAAGSSLTYLVVDLGGGRYMTLIGSGGGLTLTDLTKVAERAEITPAGLDWLGH